MTGTAWYDGTGSQYFLELQANAIARSAKDLSVRAEAFARTSDPITSHVAASTVDATLLERLVVDALHQHPNGGTVKEIATTLARHEWSISPRMKPLERKGLVRRTDERRGRSIVWRCV